MTILKSLWDRVWNNPKTSLGGGIIGGAGAAIFYYIASQAHCDLSLINWGSVITFATGQIMGAVSTDNGKAAS